MTDEPPAKSAQDSGGHKVTSKDPPPRSFWPTCLCGGSLPPLPSQEVKWGWNREDGREAAESSPALAAAPQQLCRRPFKPHKNLTWRLLRSERACAGDTERALCLLPHPTFQPPLTWVLCSWKLPPLDLVAWPQETGCGARCHCLLSMEAGHGSVPPGATPCNRTHPRCTS